MATFGETRRAVAALMIAISVSAIPAGAPAFAATTPSPIPMIPGTSLAGSSSTDVQADVTVNAAAKIGIIPATAFGLNTGVYDPKLLDPSVPNLLKQADVGVLRFPGGSIADAYQWSTNSITPGFDNTPPDYFSVAPGDSFDSFMGLVKQINGQALITINYGSNATGTGGGSPTDAANWVKYADVTHNDNVNYWEIGNEVYGNGTYGADWETDLHKNKGPQAYANNVLTYISDMKAVDPNIKIGVVLTAPYNWPWGQTPNWNQTVLKTDGSKIDFVIVHWYPQNPGNETDAGLLSSTSQIPAILARLKQEINEYSGSNASHIKIFLTETNSVSYNPGKQTTSLVNALYLDNDYMDWLQGGAANVDWFALHNYISTSGNNSSSLYGNTNYGDYGILSDGTSNDGISEPPAETPFPDYYGLEMLKYLAAPGDTMVGAKTSNSMISVHAVKQTNGNLAVMIVNKDPKNTYNVKLNLEGFRSIGPANVYYYGEGSTSIAKLPDPMYHGSLISNPYSVTTIVLHPQPKGPVSCAPNPLGVIPPSGPVGVTHPIMPVLPAPVGMHGCTPSFTESTTVANATVTPGESDEINATFTDHHGTLNKGNLDLEVYNSGGQWVGQDIVPNVSLQSGQSQSVSWDFTAPALTDTYTVKAFVFNENMTINNFAQNNAGTIVVSVPPAPTIGTQTTLSSQSVNPGQTVTITSTFTNTSALGYLNNGMLDMEVHNSSNTKVGQQSFQTSLAPGQSITETYQWTAPTTPGTYSVQLGVFSGGWSTNYYWNSTAGTITVNS